MMLKVISMTFVKKTDCEIMHRISANPDTLGALSKCCSIFSDTFINCSFL